MLEGDRSRRAENHSASLMGGTNGSCAALEIRSAAMANQRRSRLFDSGRFRDPLGNVRQRFFHLIDQDQAEVT